MGRRLARQLEDTSWRTPAGGHQLEDTSWRTLAGGHWLEDTSWKTLAGGHWQEDTVVHIVHPRERNIKIESNKIYSACTSLKNQ